MFIPEDTFKTVVAHTPLVSIDLIIEGPDKSILVGLRNNQPAKDFYFVPGGVIRKSETRGSAFKRIAAAELGLNLDISDAAFLGVYEHHYETNRFLDPSFGTHYVVLGYKLKLSAIPNILTDSQHNGIKWLPVSELLVRADVHDNTKVFFSTTPSIYL